MINQVALTGRLTRDIEVKYTQNGTAVASFTLAVNRNFTNAQGERESDFINCVIWRKSAENFSNFTRKGSLVGVQGRLQARSYDNAQGQRVFVTEVVVDNFALLESKQVTESRPHGQQDAPQQPAPVNNTRPQQKPSHAQAQPAGDPFASSDQQMTISDDDLPF